MNIIQILMWVAIYITLITIAFNFLRYGIKLNLPSSLVLSTSVSFLICGICIDESMGGFFVENIWSIIVLAALTTIILMTVKATDKTRESAIETNNQKSGQLFFISEKLIGAIELVRLPRTWSFSKVDFKDNREK